MSFMKKKIIAVVMGILLLGQSGVSTVMAETDTQTAQETLAEIRKLTGWKEIIDQKTAQKAGEICDYPSLRDGNPVKNIQAGDICSRIGTIYDAWSCVTYLDENGAEQIGYILTDVLEETEVETASVGQADLSQEAMIGQSSDTGVFAEASAIEAQIGEVVTAAEGTNLKSLGKYRITHYCPCSICCGPFTDGITSTGVTAITNRTIAVDPRIIPYGCNIVINGQVYVAEDCGGAIKGNRIDIYVATHEEANEKGVYEADVYLVQ